MPIECKICGKEFSEFIHWTHLREHNITSAGYKKMYGPTSIPGARPLSAERREKISNGVSKFGKENSSVMKARTQKALDTKMRNNYDFGAAMRGKYQSQHAKDRAKETIMLTNAQRRAEGDQMIIDKISSLELTLLNSIGDNNLELQCNKCGDKFSITKQYFHPAKFKDTICPHCFPRSKPVSNKEAELYEFVKQISPTAISSYREKYHSPELDIFIPDRNLGVEFNGLYWHSDEVLSSINQSATKDYEKKKYFNDKGIRIIQIFEDEWTTKRNIVESRLSAIIGGPLTTIYARKCSVHQITSKDAAKFCEEHHIMGKGRSNVRYGLYYQNTLVSVMTFTKSNLSRKLTGWELNRFCSITRYKIVGGASKLFSAFVRDFSPDQVISYSDNRWSDGGLYQTLGFQLSSTGTPSYWYIPKNSPIRIHRFQLRKTTSDDPTKTEYENRLDQGYSRIWDSGHSKWIWNKS